MRKIDRFERMLRDGRLVVPPLEIKVLSDPRGRVDALVDVAWRGRSFRFGAELKRDAKPLTLKLAIAQVREHTREAKHCLPMIIAPFLSREKLDQLLDAGISAIDLSGNAAIEVQGKLFFFKTGNPNQFPDNSPIRSAYRGDGSLVARVLLLERRFETVSGIRQSIQSRGGSLTLGMISKVIQRLEADLVIERFGRKAVGVIQPLRLLDGLLEAYQPPKVQDVWLGKVALPDSALLMRLQAVSEGGSIVRTGEGSAGEYAAWAGEPVISCYCRENVADVIKRLGAEARETPAFANLRLIQTEDQRVYFDARPGLAASPIQAFLEMASGDKRQKEVAEQIRSAISGERRPDER